MDPERGTVLVQSLTLGLTQIAVSLAVNTCIVLGAGFLALWLARRPVWLKLQRWFMATVLGLLAVRLSPPNAPGPRPGGKRRVLQESQAGSCGQKLWRDLRPESSLEGVGYGKRACCSIPGRGHFQSLA